MSPITINLGTNDLNGLTALCGDDVSCYFANGPAVLDNIATNLDYILSQLRAAAPDAEIITFTNYDVASLFDPRLVAADPGFQFSGHLHGGRVVGASGGCVRRL